MSRVLFVDMHKKNIGYSRTHESAITEHLLNINTYQVNYPEEFFVLTKQYLNILEAVVINTQRPAQ